MSRRVVIRAAALIGMLMVAASVVAMTERDLTRDTTVVGIFADASPLVTGSTVRAAGVKVGSVREIALDNGNARVTLEVQPSVLPLHQDAQLKIRPVNVLGENYIELDPGSPSQQFMDEAVVPLKRTKSSVTLQDVLNTFDNPTSTALAAVVTSLGEGVQGSGAEAAAAIKALAPAMRRAEDLGDVLSEQNVALNELVDRVQPVAKALAAKDGKSMDRLVGSTERTLSTLAINQEALDQTLAELPATLTEARRTLREVAGVSNAATPTLRAVRPVTDNLTEIVGELHRFADAADPALASLHPVLKRADALLTQAAPAVAKLRKAGPNLRATAKGLRPLGDELLNDHLGDVMAFVKKWSLSSNGEDALSHYLRGMAVVTPKTLLNLAESAAPAQAKGTGNRPSQPVDPGKALPEVLPGGSGDPEVLPGGSGKSDPGNATGLTPQQEQSMLGQLLGGS